MASDLCHSAFCLSLVPCLQSMGGAFSTPALGKQVPLPTTVTVLAILAGLTLNLDIHPITFEPRL